MLCFFFFQGEGGIGDLGRFGGLGDCLKGGGVGWWGGGSGDRDTHLAALGPGPGPCPLNTSDAADDLTLVYIGSPRSRK